MHRAGKPPRPHVNDYDPLRDYLKNQTLPEFVLSFEQIEEIILVDVIMQISDVQPR